MRNLPTYLDGQAGISKYTYNRYKPHTFPSSPHYQPTCYVPLTDPAAGGTPTPSSTGVFCGRTKRGPRAWLGPSDEWELPKIRGAWLGVSITRTRVFWGLYWGPLICETTEYGANLIEIIDKKMERLPELIRGYIGIILGQWKENANYHS